jgi:hypothetical protein
MKSRRMRREGHVGHIKTSIRKSEWKRPLGRPIHRWKDNIRMDIRETV